MSRAARALVLAVAVAVPALGCSTGEGDGEVTSEHLFVEGCWNGSFSLAPTFFAAQPHLDESLLIRIQRGDASEEVSDGLLVVIDDVAGIRNNQLGAELKVGMPVGVLPPGYPIVAQPKPPPPVSLALYLQETCHLQNATLYSTEGTITFSSLFSGDPNEGNADDRLTDAVFSATFGDPRKAIPGTNPPQFPAGVGSKVSGNFRFYFQRGQPAQRFP